MNGKVAIRKLTTGVPGLDAILGGGIPEFSFNLICGTPGCGKTTLAHQMMFALATTERPALYVTVLGEPPLKMLRYQQQFDFFDDSKLSECIHFVNVSEEATTGDLDLVLQRIEQVVLAHNPALLFIDSFRSVGLAAATGDPGGDRALQNFVQQLGMLMTTWQATTFLIGEYSADTESNPVFTVSDGLIRMCQSVDRNSMVRKIEIVKLRGQATLPGLHSFRISTKGVRIFPPALPEHANPQHEALPTPALLGVAGLDEMLGGGLPRGYSLLVAGPSGSGKSVLASSFLAEGARMGERGLIAAFEQRPETGRNRQVAKLIESGNVTLVETVAPDLSIDEIVALLLEQIHATGATRVVIDSLSGFELRIAPTYRADFRESMLRMVTALAASGVTVLMTSELEDRYTDLRFSPYGTAFLTDAIIVQRYIELESRLRRVLAVVKVRARGHSNELREYTIDAEGLHVGDMLTEHEGLLGGRPTLRRPHDGMAARDHAQTQTRTSSG